MTRTLLEISRYFWRNKAATIAEISEKLGIDKSTVSRRIAGLKALGFLQAQGVIEPGSSGGRKTTLYSLASDRFFVVGLDVQQDGVEGVVSNLSGDPVESFFVRKKVDRNNIVSFIASIVLERCKKYDLYGVGISLPGIIDRKKGMVVYSKALGITELPLGKEISQKLGLPVIIDNDSNVGATYYASILSQSSKNVLYFYISVPYKVKDPVGVGVGISMNNKLYHGSNSHAGEYEFKLSLVGPDLSDDLDYASFLNEYTDEQIAGAVLDFVARISQKLAFLVSIFDPDTVVIDGNVRFLPDAILSSLVESIHRNVFMNDRRKISFVKEKTNDSPNAIGASVSFLKEIFSNEDQLRRLLNTMKKEAQTLEQTGSR